MTRWGDYDDADLARLAAKGIIKQKDLARLTGKEIPPPKTVSVSLGNTNKYNAEVSMICRHKFDSKKEGQAYLRLLSKQQSGEIKTIELQPRFVLQENFERAGIKHKEIVYVADFKVTDWDDHICYIDVKSKVTEKNAVYRLKRKLLLFKFPDIDFREIL